MSRSTSVSPWVVAGLYVFAATLVLSPVSDLASTVWPPRFQDLGWRYGFLGLAAGYLQTPLLGLILAMAVAFWRDQGQVLRFSAGVSLGAAIVLLAAMAMFFMDVFAMRQVRPEDARAGILVGGLLQELKYLGACLVLALLGMGGRRMGGRRAERSARASPGPGVIQRD